MDRDPGPCHIWPGLDRLFNIRPGLGFSGRGPKDRLKWETQFKDKKTVFLYNGESDTHTFIRAHATQPAKLHIGLVARCFIL